MPRYIWCAHSNSKKQELGRLQCILVGSQQLGSTCSLVTVAFRRHKSNLDIKTTLGHHTFACGVPAWDLLIYVLSAGNKLDLQCFWNSATHHCRRQRRWFWLGPLRPPRTWPWCSPGTWPSQCAAQAWPSLPPKRICHHRTAAGGQSTRGPARAKCVTLQK